MPFQRIVVGVDFSTASLNAVRWLAGTFAPSARIFVVHVVARPRIPPFLRAVLAPDAGESESALYPGLRAFAGFAGGDPEDALIAHGNPSVELARLAADVDADLVCVGRSRRRRGSGRFGATTPQRLLAHTGIPMLIVPESAPAVPGAVLAAVSDGRDAGEVLRVSGALASTWDVRLDAMHALEPEVVATVRSLDDVSLCTLAREWIAEQRVACGTGGAEFQAVARVGDAGEEVVAHAARNGIGLIVTGRRVRHHAPERASGSAGVGSTTRLITWATSCPVLVLGSGAIASHGGPYHAPRRGRVTPPLERVRTVHGSSRRRFLTPPDGGDAA
jgi:nucleotide-binding universal stress UspA family protein